MGRPNGNYEAYLSLGFLKMKNEEEHIKFCYKQKTQTFTVRAKVNNYLTQVTNYQ